jgi:hypothetical protein
MYLTLSNNENNTFTAGLSSIYFIANLKFNFQNIQVKNFVEDECLLCNCSVRSDKKNVEKSEPWKTGTLVRETYEYQRLGTVFV